VLLYDAVEMFHFAILKQFFLPLLSFTDCTKEAIDTIFLPLREISLESGVMPAFAAGEFFENLTNLKCLF